ncbi:MAPKAP1 family protein [Megaselia abdita]
MATYNNPHWLLSHIRNSFISTDETGMCENVMMNQDLPKHFLQKCEQLELNCYPGLDEQSDDEDFDLTAQSFDIMFPEHNSYRFRSNTAQRLEKMDIARKKASRMKSIKVCSESSNDNDYKNFFVAKTELVPPPDNMKSLLTDQLIKTPVQPKNKFAQYAKYDGTSHTGIVTKKFKVFINMLPDDKRSYPLPLCVIADTKILDIIGLICYKCLIQFPGLVLGDVRNYGLYIAEDNGEMEALPPLDVRESFAKFKFSHFTLVERRSNSTTTSRNDYRTMSITSDGDYGGEGASGTERKPNTLNKNEIEIQKMFDRIEAPLYRTYRVYCRNFFFRNEVQLGVSGERIEIDPIPQKNSKLWKKQKAVSYNIDHIAFIELHEERTSKSVLRMWYGYPQQTQTQLTPNEAPATMSVSPQHLHSYFNNFKYYDFETDKITAQQILSKINCLLEIRSSFIHKEFLTERDKKKEKK